MSRPYTGKTTECESRITHKNGVTYVYRRKVRYNQETHRTETISTKLEGKILPGTTEVIPTRHRSPKGCHKELASAIRRHAGLTDILEWIGRESGIDSDVKASLGAGEADKTLSIARYWLGTDGNTLPRLEGWQLTHELPYRDGISEDVYGELFKSLRHNESGIQSYFFARAARLSVNPVIAYDSTTISTFSANQKEARRGFNKEGDGLPTIKLLTLYSVKDEEPIAFAKQPGNVPDVVAIENAIAQLKCLGISRPLVTADTGYYSESNLMELCRRNMKFLVLADTNISLARKAVDALRPQLESMVSVCPFDCGVSGASMMVSHTFYFQRRRTRGGVKAGERMAFERRLYLHVFKSSALRERHETAFRQKLLDLKSQLEEGVADFTEAARKKIELYLVCSRTGRGGRLHVSFNEEECRKARENFGYFVLVSNESLGTFEALEDYRRRERIEELFQAEKENVDGRRPRLWYPDALKGRMFVQFVSLGYRCFILKKIKQIKNTLCLNGEDKTKEQFELERKLLVWLKQRSLAQILDWFDCVEETTVKTPAGERRWQTESVERDRLFLKLLGVPNSCIN